MKGLLEEKKVVPKGRSKADKDKSIIEAVKKVRVEKKHHATIDFPSTTKKPK